MINHTSDFLKKVCNQIKYKKIHNDIKTELLGHIDEIKAEYMNNGMSDSEAEKKAIKQMGNPDDIGKELNKTHKPKIEWSIVLLIGLMSAISGGVLYFLSKDIAYQSSTNISISHYFTYLLIGIIGGAIFYFFDYTKLEKYSLHLFIITNIFLFLSNWFPTINGNPYITIGSFVINPITISIPILLISFSGLLIKWGNENLKNMLKLIGLSIVSIFMCLTNSSLANPILLGTGFLVMFTVSIMNKNFQGNRVKSLLLIYGINIGGGLIALVFTFISYSYRYQRILSFFQPSSDPNGSGYLYLTIKKLLSGAKLLGEGAGLHFATENSGFGLTLPLSNSEFIFTYIVSAFGWIAGIGLILIIMLTILRMTLTIGKINTIYGKYISSSIVTLFTLQIISNILMNLGLFPIIGISLPIISYGGTNFIVSMALVGLMLGIYRRKDLVLSNNLYE
ncbi:MAG: FtsW/RodA/SpoVE family cell cycle protein [Firmicutes bacterium]|nr:FtsW/RodA/SpoVE family cell cycle protein [Bacillota bacterium]